MLRNGNWRHPIQFTRGFIRGWLIGYELGRELGRKPTEAELMERLAQRGLVKITHWAPDENGQWAEQESMYMKGRSE